MKALDLCIVIVGLKKNQKKNKIKQFQTLQNKYTSDCRKAHSAPLYHCCYVPINTFKITEGEENLKYFQGKNQNLKRYFCSSCGTKIYNHLVKEDCLNLFQYFFLFL